MLVATSIPATDVTTPNHPRACNVMSRCSRVCAAATNPTLAHAAQAPTDANVVRVGPAAKALIPYARANPTNKTGTKGMQSLRLDARNHTTALTMLHPTPHMQLDKAKNPPCAIINRTMTRIVAPTKNMILPQYHQRSYSISLFKPIVHSRYIRKRNRGRVGVPR